MSDDGALVPDELSSLLVRYLPDLRAFVRLQVDAGLREQESRSDLVQSVCLEVLAHPERFEMRGEAEFRSWLFGAVLQKVRGHRRYHAAQKRDRARLEAHEDVDRIQELGRSYVAFLTPSGAAILAEELRALEVAFEQLDDEQRSILCLHRFAGLTHAEIGVRLGKSEVAVRKQLHRAMVRLTTLMRPSQ